MVGTVPCVSKNYFDSPVAKIVFNSSLLRDSRLSSLDKSQLEHLWKETKDWEYLYIIYYGISYFIYARF